MASLPFNYKFEEINSIYTTASETMASNTPGKYTSESESSQGIGESVFSPHAPVFKSRSNDIPMMMNPPEPRAADPAPTSASTIDIEKMLMNLRENGGETHFDSAGVEQNSRATYYNSMGDSSGIGSSSRSDSISSNIWGEGSSSGGKAKNEELVDTFDFFMKSLTAANHYVSMLTREQLFVLRAIRPGLICELLLEVARIRSEKPYIPAPPPTRRALPSECAFCKNNGESEDIYSNHALKDWRGRVLCPVLKAFKCPRCGATGERAHTIKYCPENSEGLDRASFLARRRTASFILSHQNGHQQNGQPSSPSASTSSMSHSPLWSNFGIN